MSHYSNFLQLADQRKTIHPQLWIVGCSFSHGSCVHENERFGQLLADNLSLEVSFLTSPGSSIEWAADQILRSDIKSGDTVVWGLTGASRIPWGDESHSVHHITHHSYDSTPEIRPYINKPHLISSHMIYEAVTHVKQVENYLSKVGARFVLACMPANGPETDLIMNEFVSPLSYAIMMYDIHDYKFIDYGWDNLHPGPIQHTIYAKLIEGKLHGKSDSF